MSSAFIQTSSGNATTIAIALIALFVAIGAALFLFARSRQRRDRESRVRGRMLEMEREAQFGGAADRVAISKKPADVALQIARLLREYMSTEVLAVYAGAAADLRLWDVLRSANTESTQASNSGLPDTVPASLVAEHTRPVVVSLSKIAGRQPTGARAAQIEQTHEPSTVQSFEESTAAVTQPPAGEIASAEQIEGGQPTIAIGEPSTTRSFDDVVIIPWKGAFEWNGLIVTSRPPGLMPDAIESHREALTRLTDKLAVALEFERGDAAMDSSRQRAARITDFSRSLISCLEAKSPLDAIVAEVRRLVGSDSAALWRVDEASGMVRMAAADGLKSPEFLPLPVGQGLAGSVAQSGEALAIEDAPSDPRCIFPREARESGVVAYLGAPASADGKTLGVVEAHCAARRAWSEGDKSILESAAAIIAELIKTTDSRGNRLRVESAYLGLSESLQRLRSADEVKEAVVEVLGHALGASRVIVVGLSDRDQPEPVKHEHRRPGVKSALGVTFDEALFANAAESVGGQPIAIADSRERSLAGADAAAELGVLSELAAPIRVEGKTRAIVYVHQCDRVREWDQDEIEFADRVIRQLSLSLANLSSLEAAFNDAQLARAEEQRARDISREAPARIRELEEKLQSVESALAESRSSDEQNRAMVANASALEAKARAEADVSRRVESEVRQQLDRIQEEHKQAQESAQQLLEINRLKSEFIVNAGHEMEASLQPVLGLAELLENGSYGVLSPEQREAVHGIYGWARRIKSDIDWLVEYGSTRSRRLESSGG